MTTVVGPILARASGYAFDTWEPGQGLSAGFVYRRFDDARYARSAMLRALAAAVGCDTDAQFRANAYDVINVQRAGA